MALSRITWFSVLIAVALLLVTVALYWPVVDQEFVHFDDTRYVLENRAVQHGVDATTIEWAFTTDRMGTWHPLTWLSHAVDWSLYGSDAGGHHLTNLLLHLANVLLLFGVLRKMTGHVWASAFVAFVFAVHPINVASVAWIASRKGVLSTTFWFLTMWAYADYAREGGTRRYLWVVLALALGLMSKPMLVSLPFVLLLLDVWPLGRMSWNGRGIDSAKPFSEKIPLFAMAAAVSVVVFLVRRIGDPLGGGERLAQVPVGYALYLRRLLWPAGLATPYPPLPSPTVTTLALAILVLLGISVLAFQARRERPFIAVGWLWFLITLAPVIGVVQIGGYSMADRWIYVPMVGVLIVVAWGVPSFLPRGDAVRASLGAASILVVLSLFWAAHKQVGYWQNTETLFERALAVTEDNRTAHYNLGFYFAQHDRPDDAVIHYRRAIEISPEHFPSHHNLALVLVDEGRHEEAIEPLCASLRLAEPDADELRELFTTHLQGAECPE